MGRKIYLKFFCILFVVVSTRSVVGQPNGLFFDLEQGPELFVNDGKEPYFFGFRTGFSHVWIKRSFMSSSWNFYSDIVAGIYRANPGTTASLSIMLHKFLIEWLDPGLPSYNTIGFYLFLEPGYMFHMPNSPDKLGNSWYSAGGLEIGAGGVFLSLSMKFIFPDGTHESKATIKIPQIGAKIYFYP